VTYFALEINEWVRSQIKRTENRKLNFSYLKKQFQDIEYRINRIEREIKLTKRKFN